MKSKTLNKKLQTDNLRGVFFVVSLSLNFTTKKTQHKLRLNLALCEKGKIMHLVKFINLEEYENDLIVSFAVSDGEQDISSLILLRTLLYEELLEKYERGVHVSFEGITNKQELSLIHI